MSTVSAVVQISAMKMSQTGRQPGGSHGSSCRAITKYIFSMSVGSDIASYWQCLETEMQSTDVHVKKDL